MNQIFASRPVPSMWMSQPSSWMRWWQAVQSRMPLERSVGPFLLHHWMWWTSVQATGAPQQAQPPSRRARASFCALRSVDWNAELVSGDLADAVRDLKAHRDVYVGGVTLPAALAALDLIDEYEFVVHPRIAGHGPRLFDGLTTPIDLVATGRKDLRSGLVVTSYVPRSRT